MGAVGAPSATHQERAPEGLWGPYLKTEADRETAQGLRKHVRFMLEILRGLVGSYWGSAKAVSK